MKRLFRLFVLLGLVAGSTAAFGYPESVRYGYASCAACHVSPTGGGALTQYGRASSEQFMSTWATQGEGGFGHRDLALPEWLILGGEFRNLAYVRDTKVFKERGVIPMQAEVQVGATAAGVVSGVATIGTYDRSLQLQTFYLLANAGEHAFVRVGRFFPAFGINTPEHALITRKGLGFNQGQQTLNAELGLVGEEGEVIATAVLMQGWPELSSEEKGVTARTALYIGGQSQVGVSVLSLKGSVWKRAAVGGFVTTGLTQSTYLLAELDQERKTPATFNDPSVKASTRVVSTAKLGWEFLRGAHVYTMYEGSVTALGSHDPRLFAAGGGAQWFPRPHLELMTQLQRRTDETWSREPGYRATFVVHYNL